jgi:hypothetical protein
MRHRHPPEIHFPFGFLKLIVIPTQIRKITRDFSLLQTEMQRLSESVARLNPPQLIGGFKQHTSIHQTVPGSFPLRQGIIAHLTNECGGNVCDRHFVHSFSETDRDGSVARNVADLSTDSYFMSKQEPNQSIGYDFKDHRLVSLTHYALRSQPYLTRNDCHPRSWVLEGTNDRSNSRSWTEIDRRWNNQDLNGPGLIQTFEIPNRPSPEFRYIRLRQIDKNHGDCNCLRICSFELFGVLRTREPVPI